MELERIFCKVLSLDLAAIVAVGLVLIARFCLRKAPKRCSYLLWSVVLLRLVIPFSLKLPGKSLLPVSTDTFNTDLAFKAVPVIDSGNRLVDDAVNSILPAAEVGASANPMQIWLAVGTVVWVAGMTLLAVLSLVKYFRLALLLTDSERQGNTAVSEKLGTAFVLGIFRPVICLPAGLSESEREMIIAHESAHIKRGDHIVKLIAYILLVIHWYNPVMWLAFGLMTRDMEMSCDEAVINSGCDRSDYAEALLRLSVGKEILPAIPPTFGEGAVKERIVNVMKCNVSNTFVSFIAIIAAALIAVTCVVTGSPNMVTVEIPHSETNPSIGVRFELPTGWKVGGEYESYYPELDGKLIAINDRDGNLVATVGARSYINYSEEDSSQYPDPSSENYWQAVYTELRLPAHKYWEIDPATSIRTDDGETMLSKIYTQIPEEGVPAAGWDVVETKGIVSYNESKHVYTFISFYTNEYEISDETIKNIAESLEFVAEK